MPGQNQAPNLSGMFQQINAPLSQMGDAGNMYVETLRRSFAPEVNMNDSESLARYAEYARRNNYKDEAQQFGRMSYDAAERERQTEERLGVQRGRASIAEIRNKMTALYDDPSLSVQERNAKMDAYQEQINEIAGSTNGMNPNDYALVSQNIDTYYTERKRNEEADERARRQVEIQEARLGLDENADARAQQRHRQMMESGELELENAQITQQINKLTLANQRAKAFVGQEGGKEAFLALPGMSEYGGLFDQAQLEYETQQANKAVAEANAQQAGFNYTQAELEEMLYLMPDPKKAAKDLLTTAKGSVAAAHNRLVTMINGQSATNKLPESTMLKLFENMAAARLEAELSGAAAGSYAYQDTSRSPWATDGDKTQAMGKLSAAMLNAYMAAPNPAQGLQDVQMILTYGLSPSAESQDDASGTEGGEPSIEDLAAQLGITVE